MNYVTEQSAKSALVCIALMVLIVGAVFPLNGAAAKKDELDLYIAPKTEFLPVGELLAHLLESRLALEVNKKIQYLDIGLRKTANGQGDLFIGLKLPMTRKVSWDYSLYQLCDLGPIYEDVISGFATPAYVPEGELDSAEDLADSNIKARLHNEIIVYGFDESLREESKKLVSGMKELQDYKLVELGEMVANSELSRAIRNKEWIVTTLKRPSIPFSLNDLRFIEELTEEQSVHLFGRRSLMEDYSSKVTQFLSRFYLSIELVDELVRMRDADKASAVRNFVDKHPALVKYWLEGVTAL